MYADRRGHFSVLPAVEEDTSPGVPDVPDVSVICIQLKGQARPGQARPGQARPGQARPGQARPGQARPGQARPGQARPGQARPGQARPGHRSATNRRPINGNQIILGGRRLVFRWSLAVGDHGRPPVGDLSGRRLPKTT